MIASIPGVLDQNHIWYFYDGCAHPLENFIVVVLIIFSNDGYIEAFSECQRISVSPSTGIL